MGRDTHLFGTGLDLDRFWSLRRFGLGGAGRGFLRFSWGLPEYAHLIGVEENGTQTSTASTKKAAGEGE